MWQIKFIPNQLYKEDQALMYTIHNYHYSGTSPFSVFFGREANYNLHPKVADDMSVSNEVCSDELEVTMIKINKKILNFVL